MSILKKFFIGIVIILVVVILGFVASLIFVAKKKPQPAAGGGGSNQTSPVEQIAPRTINLIGERIKKPVQSQNRIYFVAENGQLKYYDFQNNQTIDTGLNDQVLGFNILAIIPLEGMANNIAVWLEKISDQSRQFAAIDLERGLIATKFSPRLKTITWLPEQQKILGYAVSQAGTPFFLTASLDAKNQKVIAQNVDQDAVPLILLSDKIIYRVSNEIKILNTASRLVEEFVKIGREATISSATISPDAKTIAYATDEGLRSASAESGASAVVSNSKIAFFNWSKQLLIYGAQSQDQIEIFEFNVDTGTKKSLGAIALTDIVPSIEAAFEDASNNQILYWSNGFLLTLPLANP